MSDNQQKNRDQEHTGDDIPEGQTRKFKYKPPSFYSLRLIIAKYEINAIEDFFDRAKEAWRKGQQDLERIAARSGENVPDDWLVDDVVQLKEFAWLYSEFAIIGLWRCIELYRKSAMKVALGKDASERAYKHRPFQKDLLRLKIEETKIRCAKSVNELRCLNNAIKHERRVNGELAEFHRWKNRKGNKLGDLESHYVRLRPFAKQYLEDLTDRLNNAQIPSPSAGVQVGKT